MFKNTLRKIDNKIDWRKLVKKDYYTPLNNFWDNSSIVPFIGCIMIVSALVCIFFMAIVGGSYTLFLTSFLLENWLAFEMFFYIATGSAFIVLCSLIPLIILLFMYMIIVDIPLKITAYIEVRRKGFKGKHAQEARDRMIRILEGKEELEENEKLLF